MGIGAIELQGSIQRLNDYATVKHNEDNKSAINQSNYANTVHKTVEDNATSVRRGDDASNNQKKFDAKEKGSNEYYGDGGRQGEKKQKPESGKVVVKNQTSTFDIRI